MATNYPSALDSTGTTLPDNKTNATLTVDDHDVHHNNLADAVIAVETALGISPAGSYSTVAAAILNKVDLSPGSAQVLLPTADVVALTIKQHNLADASNIMEWRLGNNAIGAYVDKSGIFSAQGLKIAGSSLSSSNLSDGSTLAKLAGPALTGTPTAPTAAVDTNTTQIATTAFVLAQAASATPLADSTGAAGTSTRYARADHVHPHDTTLLALAGGTLTGLLITASSGIQFNDGSTMTTAAGTAPTTNGQTGTTYTLVIGDQDNIVEMLNASANTVTIPLNSTVPFSVGHTITIIQTGAGQTTIAATGGVTLNSTPGLKIAAQWGAVTLLKRATNTWVAMGNLTA